MKMQLFFFLAALPARLSKVIVNLELIPIVMPSNQSRRKLPVIDIRLPRHSIRHIPGLDPPKRSHHLVRDVVVGAKELL